MSGQDDRLVRRAVEAAARRVAGEPCPEPDVLGLYADRGLDDAERGLVDDHLAGCTRCQATVAALVRSAPEAADVAGAAETAGGVRAWWTGWRWLVPATATAAVVTLAVWVGRGPSERAAEADRAGASAPPAAAEASPDDRRQNEAPSAARSDLAATAPAPAAGRDAARPGGAASGAGAPQGAREKAAAGSATVAPAPAPAPGSANFADLRPAAPAPAAAAPAVGAAASETRLERAEPERQREEARVAAAAEQARPQATAAPPPPAPPNALPPQPARAPLPPPPASAVAPPPAPGQPPATLQESMRVADPPAARPSERSASDQAAAGAMSKATASDPGATTRRMVELTGRVTYRTRQALPAGAIIEVQLLDVSRADAPAQALGRTSIVTKGEQVPVPFVITYDSSTIDARRRYVVQATITIAGRVALRTTTAHPVLTGGGSGTDLEVVVQPAR